MVFLVDNPCWSDIWRWLHLDLTMDIKRCIMDFQWIIFDISICVIFIGFGIVCFWLFLWSLQNDKLFRLIHHGFRMIRNRFRMIRNRFRMIHHEFRIVRDWFQLIHDRFWMTRDGFRMIRYRFKLSVMDFEWFIIDPESFIMDFE